MNTVDVLIVGAGPAGLTAACGLAQRGVDVMVVDAAAAGVSTSRAAVVHARTLEVLERIGAAESLVQEGLVVPEFTVRDASRELARLDFGGLPTRYPYTLMIPQSRTEQLLEKRLTALGGEVRRSVELVALPVVGDRHHAVIDPGGRGAEEIRPRFVVGADGAHSRVRSEAGIAFRGAEYAQSFVLADVTMRWPLPSHEVQLFLSRDGLMVVAPLPGGRHRIVATVEGAVGRPSAADVQSLLDTRGPGGTEVTDLAWSSRFTVSHRLAERYRSRNVLLAGDAAHVHSPAGGQGMNTGMQDAVELSSLLAEVVAGRAPESDLADYERRRRPVAAGVVALTDRMTRLATIRGAVPRRVRNLVLSSVLRSSRARTALATRIAEL